MMLLKQKRGGSREEMGEEEDLGEMEEQKDSKWVLRPPKRDLSPEGLLRMAGQSRSPLGQLSPSSSEPG